MKRMTLGISAAVLILAGTGYAAENHGLIAHPETRAEAQARAEHLFNKLDLNHDGKLDQADRAVRVTAMFDRLDTNHDGMISRDEFAAAHQHMRLDDANPGHEGPGHGGPDHPGMLGEHAGGHMGHRGDTHHGLGGLVMLILQRADPSHSGTVTRDAFVRAALSLFDQADTNHDGTVTAEEHRAFAQAMHGQMPQQPNGPDGEMPPPPAH